MGNGSRRRESVPAGEALIDDRGRLATGWRVTLAAVATMIVGPPPVLILAFGLVVPQFQRSFAWSVPQIAAGATIMSLTLLLISPLQGVLVDRLGARRTILFSIPAFGIGLALLSRMGSDVLVYYVLSALLPIAGIGLWPLSYMKMVSTWFEARLGLALGVLNLGNGLGGALMPLFFLAMFSAVGWRAAYATLAAVNLLVAWPIAWLCFRENPGIADRRTPAERSSAPLPISAGLTLREALATTDLARLAIVFAVVGALSTGTLVHQFKILVERGVPESEAALLQSMLGLCSIFGQLTAGWLLDRVAFGRVLAAMLMLIAIGMVAYTTAYAVPLAALSVASVGIMIGAEMNIMGFCVKRCFGERSFGAIYGLLFALFSCGGAAGGQFLAYARAASGDYASGLETLAVTAMLAALVVVGMTRYRFAPGR